MDPTGRGPDGVRSPAPERPAGASSEGERLLHLCPTCASNLVYPIDWAEHGMTEWVIDLRCPECGWQDAGVFPQRLADAFDEELDRGTYALVSDLDRLVRANMTDVVERFSRALEAGAILPEDF